MGKTRAAEEKDEYAKQLREAQQIAFQRFMLDKLNNEPRLRRLDASEATEPDASAATLSSERKLPGKLNAGQYEVLGAKIGAGKEERFLKISVDEEGGITPTSDIKNPKEFTQIYQQVINAYAAYGTKNLKLDFPKIEDPKDVNLNKVMELLEIAGNNNVSMSLSPKIMARLAMDPKTPAEKQLMADIHEKVQALKAAQAQNAELKKLEIAAAMPVHVGELAKDAVKLDSARNKLEAALKGGKEEQIVPAIQAMSDSMQQLGAVLANASKQPLQELDGKIRQDYHGTLASAQEKLNLAQDLISNKLDGLLQKAPEDAKSAEVLSGVEKLKTDLADLACKAVPAQLQRVELAKDELMSMKADSSDADVTKNAEKLDKAMAALESSVNMLDGKVGAGGMERDSINEYREAMDEVIFAFGPEAVKDLQGNQHANQTVKDTLSNLGNRGDKLSSKALEIDETLEQQASPAPKP